MPLRVYFLKRQKKDELHVRLGSKRILEKSNGDAIPFYYGFDFDTLLYKQYRFPFYGINVIQDTAYAEPQGFDYDSAIDWGETITEQIPHPWVYGINPNLNELTKTWRISEGVFSFSDCWWLVDLFLEICPLSKTAPYKSRKIGEFSIAKRNLLEARKHLLNEGVDIDYFRDTDDNGKHIYHFIEIMYILDELKDLIPLDDNTQGTVFSRLVNNWSNESHMILTIYGNSDFKDIERIIRHDIKEKRRRKSTIGEMKVEYARVQAVLNMIDYILRTVDFKKETILFKYAYWNIKS